MDLELTGKTALVTGSHRGTGKVIARQLLAEGAKVLVHGFEEQVAAETAAELANGSREVLAVWGDPTNETGAEELCRQLDAFEIDLLVNNYGTASRGSWLESDDADWTFAYQHNVLSAQRLIRYLLPGMKERGFGRILNLGTIGSTSPRKQMPHYYAAKGALATLTASLAREVGDSGVRVNLVSPGLIRTPEVEQHFLEVGRKKGWGTTWKEIEPHVARDAPIGRIATRQEVADLVVFLCSPRADAIHGQNIRIDGGVLNIVG